MPKSSEFQYLTEMCLYNPNEINKKKEVELYWCYVKTFSILNLRS
jgi:hypothetical protein